MTRISDGPVRKHTALHKLNEAMPASGVVVEGKVIATHPEDSTVDVALYGGQILRRVRVLFNSANTVAGFRYLASIKNADSAQNSENGIMDKAVLTHKADTLATIVYVQGQTLAPRVIGFSFPIDAQMHVNEQGLAMMRHESGVYTLIDKTGHHETHYPDGSYVIAGLDTTPKQLSVGDGAQAWNIASESPISLTIHLSQGVDISIQNGNVNVTASNLTFRAQDANGDYATLAINGSGSITATKHLTSSGQTISNNLV